MPLGDHVVKLQPQIFSQQQSTKRDICRHTWHSQWSRVKRHSNASTATKLHYVEFYRLVLLCYCYLLFFLLFISNLCTSLQLFSKLSFCFHVCAWNVMSKCINNCLHVSVLLFQQKYTLSYFQKDKCFINMHNTVLL